MNRMVTVFSLLALSLAPVHARADVFAAVNVAAPPPRTDLDVAVVNASLGTRVSLPSRVNTGAFEIHPRISRDGRRLLFKRFGGSDGTRLLLFDTSTGDSADLFGPTEIVADTIYNSEITEAGTSVLTGRRFRGSAGTFTPQVTVTDVSAFPTGPYPRFSQPVPASFGSPGSTTDVSYRDGVYALRVLVGSSPLGAIVMFGSGIPVPFVLSAPSIDYGHPSLPGSSADFGPAGVISGASVHFDRRRLVGLLRYTTSDIGLYRRITTSLGSAGEYGYPAFLDTEADESQPALMGRYLAFVRHGSDGHDRLFVFDQTTRIFLNPNGVDLGVVATRGIGSVSLYERAVLATSTISRTGQVNATLTSASSIGIFVQRIVAEQKLRGERSYELETVGRVPLGSYGAGNVFTHWDFEVDGEPLAPGKYLVTVRAVEGDIVRELGESQVLKIGKKGSPKGEIR